VFLGAVADLFRGAGFDKLRDLLVLFSVQLEAFEEEVVLLGAPSAPPRLRKRLGADRTRPLLAVAAVFTAAAEAAHGAAEAKVGGLKVRRRRAVVRQEAAV